MICSNRIRFCVIPDIRRYFMRHSVFLTIKLVILMNIFLIPFAVISESIIIRFITGSLLGMSLIIFLSFTAKVQSVFEKDKEH